jgi:DNA-binding PadR family transcriptional regulator
MWHHRHLRRHWLRAHRLGPWGGPGRFFGPGEVRLALLSLLSEEPKHGYELMKQLESRSGGVYRASAGTVYPTLQQLQDEGLVSSEQQDGKRVFRLTEAGEREVEAHEAAIRRIWRRADDWGDWSSALDPEAAELARPAFRVARAALRAAARNDYDPDALDQIREILERATDELRDIGERRPR